MELTEENVKSITEIRAKRLVIESKLRTTSAKSASLLADLRKQIHDIEDADANMRSDLQAQLNSLDAELDIIAKDVK